MSSKQDTTRVASHTEYARTRIQCLDCGQVAPVDGEGTAKQLCVRCR
ncbi:hypothetical protein ACFR97_08965 [Haloplanus litoreus]|uniref:Uncharacterized protein n=1 Tax=Haloplanus litoreus TaxID=767515 RepID=A0ABD5ZUF2_9EURY